MPARGTLDHTPPKPQYLEETVDVSRIGTLITGNQPPEVLQTYRTVVHRRNIANNSEGSVYILERTTSQDGNVAVLCTEADDTIPIS